MRPMLAAKFDEKRQRFPALASPKLDGIRAIILDGTVYSRSWKPIPNRHVQATFGRPEYNGLDGELIVGSPTAPNCMQATTSGVMSFDGQPDVSLHAFDCVSLPHYEPFQSRLQAVHDHLQAYGGHIYALPHVWCSSLESVYKYEEQCLTAGYEGIILRDPAAEYKQGRSTVNEGGMIKLKRFTDSEAVIIGAVELMHNSNAATLDERGYTKRSHCQDGKVPMGVLGALQVADVHTGAEFEIGTGFTELDRIKLWRNRASLPGLYVKYKHFAYGQKDKPRQPVFLGFRHMDDF
jgi:DNA ligase-1